MKLGALGVLLLLSLSMLSGLLLVVPQAAHATGIALDGSNKCSSDSCTLSTSVSGDLIVAVTVANSSGFILVGSVSDTSSLFWTEFSANENVTGASYLDNEIWYAVAPSTLSGDTISVSWSGAFDNADMVVFGLSGVNTTSPFDTGTGGGGGSIGPVTAAQGELIVGEVTNYGGVACPCANATQGYSSIQDSSLLVSEYKTAPLAGSNSYDVTFNFPDSEYYGGESFSVVPSGSGPSFQSGWIPTGAPIPLLNGNPSCYTYSGYVYCAGYEGSSTVRSYSTTISSTGEMGASWTAQTTFTDMSGTGVQCFGYLGYIYCLDDGTGDTWSASLTSGTISSWTPTTAYTQLTVYFGSHVNVAPGLVVSGGYVYAIGGNSTDAFGAVCKPGTTCPDTLYGTKWGYLETQVASLSGGTIGSWSAVVGTSQYSQPVLTSGDTSGNAPVSCALVGSDIYCLGSLSHHTGVSHGEYVGISSPGTLSIWATTVETGGPDDGGASCFGWASQFTCIMGSLKTFGVTNPTGDVLTYSGGGSGTWSAIGSLSPYAAAYQSRTTNTEGQSACQTDGSVYITCIDLQFSGNYFTSSTAAYFVNSCESAFTTSASYQVLCMDFPDSATIAQGGQGDNYQSSASAGTCTVTVTAGDLIVDAVYTSRTNFAPGDYATDSLGNLMLAGMNRTFFAYYGASPASHFIVSYAIAATSGSDTFSLSLGSGSYASFCYDVSGVSGTSAGGAGQVGSFGKGTGSAPATVGQDVLDGQLLVALMTAGSSGTYTAGSGFYLNAAGTVHDTVDSLYVASEINAPSLAAHFAITIETNPLYLKNALTIQGVPYLDNPVMLSVVNGTVISLKAASTALKMPGFLMYSFSHWSQGGAQDQSYTVTGNVTLVADYTSGGSSFCSTFSGTGANALEQQLNHGCEWSVVFNSWFALLGPYLLAFIDFLPALAIYLRTESPAAGMGVYVLVYIVLVAGLAGTHLTSFPTTIDTVAPGLLGAVIAGSLFQLSRSGKGG